VLLGTFRLLFTSTVPQQPRSSAGRYRIGTHSLHLSQCRLPAWLCGRIAVNDKLTVR
jgi:hypothetical protein